MNDAVQNRSNLMFLMDKKQLYKFQMAHPSLDPLLRVLLRSYGGLFDTLGRIDEKLIASRLKVSKVDLEKQLTTLSNQGVVEYHPKTSLPKVTYLTGRQEDKNIRLDASIYSNLRKSTEKRMLSMIDYLKEYRCRNIQLLRYFGENEAQVCGTCDVCLERKKLELGDEEFEQIEIEIKNCLKKQKMDSEALSSALPKRKKEKLWKVLRWMIDTQELKMNEKKELVLIE